MILISLPSPSFIRHIFNRLQSKSITNIRIYSNSTFIDTKPHNNYKQNKQNNEMSENTTNRSNKSSPKSSIFINDAINRVQYPIGKIPSIPKDFPTEYKPFSVACFNLLANSYLHSNTDYPEAIRFADWASKSNRIANMKKELIALNVDILCLQEIELDEFDEIEANNMKLAMQAEAQKKLQKQQEKEQNQKLAHVRKSWKNGAATPNSASASPNISNSNSVDNLAELKIDDSSANNNNTNTNGTTENKIEESKSPNTPTTTTTNGNSIGSHLRAHGYNIIIQNDISRKSGHNVGTAICYRTSTFERVHWKDSRSRALLAALQLRKLNDTNTNTDADTTSHIAIDPNSLVYVVSCHLQGHPTLVQNRFDQMKSLLKELSKQQMKDNEINKNNSNWHVRYCNTIITGDFNSNNHSSVYELLKKGKLSNKHLDAENNIVIETNDFNHSYQLSDPYSSKLPSFTYARPSKGWLIDFIFFSSPSLYCNGIQSVFESLTEEQDILRTGLPTPKHVSDHLAIGASFLVKSRSITPIDAQQKDQTSNTNAPTTTNNNTSTSTADK